MPSRPLSIKGRRGSIVKGLPILSLKGIPFWFRVISLSVSSRVSNFPFILLLLLLLQKLGAPHPWRQSSARVFVLILLLLYHRAC